jgi:hypothetical protein
MPVAIKMHDIVRMKEQVDRLRTRTDRIKEEAKDMIHTLVRTTEVSATAFGLGVVQGRYGPVEVLGVPLELGGGIAAHLAGLLGLGGNFSGHLHNFGDGFLATYMATVGRGAGLQWKHKAVPGVAGTSSLTDAERSQIAR